MEYILLTLIVLITISKLKGLKNLFKSRESYRKDLSSFLDKAEAQYGKDGKDIFLGIGIIFMMLLCLMYLIFYILAMTYVGSVCSN